MATVELTDYQLQVATFNVEGLRSPIAVPVIRINDEFSIGDTISMSSVIAGNILSAYSFYDTIVAPGGTTNEYNSSDFGEENYPIESTPTDTNVKFRIEKIGSVSLVVYMKVGNTDIFSISPHAVSGRISLCPVFTNSSGDILFFNINDLEGKYAGGEYNSFTHCLNNYGFPIASTDGYTPISGFSYTVLQIQDYNIEDLGATIEDVSSTDPFDPGGTSGDDTTGGTGGTGTFDGTGDSIDFPSLPTLSAVDTGFIKIFNPSSTQLKNLANYMWSDDFSLDTFKKIFADPMQAVLGLSMVPVNVPAGGYGVVTVGNISTGVAMTKAASQYVAVDCGTLNVSEYWGAYLDYDPYTKCEIYLPYCGMHPLKTDDVMGKAVHVVYHVDILSGACCAYVKCGSSIIYSFVGACSCSVPITGDDFTNVINGILGIAGSIGTMVASGGMSAPLSAAAVVGGITSTAGNVMSMKPTVERSGSFGGMGGMLGVQTPYLILTRPNQCLPAYQNAIEGYPSYITRTVSSLSGYTVFEEIHLSGLSCTDAEKDEIEKIMKSGVIL